MDSFVVSRGGSLAELRDQVRRLEDLGASGFLMHDHIFVTEGKPRPESRKSEALVVLAAVAALSERLQLGTIVSNVALLHPALLLRQFAQLAVLVGGDRVLAGLGAGWNREEFEALGLQMASLVERLERLEESARLARALFDHGVATLEGRQVIARDLPLAPLPAIPPRLLLGGGSDRLLEIAGRYADALDLNGCSRAGAARGPNARLPNSESRRLSTTVADLEHSIAFVRATARAAGRPTDAVSFSVSIGDIAFCADSEVAERAAAIAAPADLPGEALEQCPYVLLGEPERMRDKLRLLRERLGLRQVIFPIGTPWPTIERLHREVLPLVY